MGDTGRSEEINLLNHCQMKNTEHGFTCVADLLRSFGCNYYYSIFETFVQNWHGLGNLIVFLAQKYLQFEVLLFGKEV